MPQDERYAEEFVETTVIEEWRRETYGVESSGSGFGAVSVSVSTSGGGGAPSPGLQPPDPSGTPPPNPDEPWTEISDEPILDDQGDQIGVRRNERTTDPQTGEVRWSIIDEAFGRVTAETYGVTSPDGSSSYTDRYTAADGSTQLTTRTVEPGGRHGREVRTDVDPTGTTVAESITEW